MKRTIGCILTCLLLLLLVACDSGQRERMEALLDRADSLNRAYISMTGGLDTLLLEATKYYDRHGTPNEQLRAHYLLGCAYRDMGEAPAALSAYHDAVERVDTTDADCDYRRLMSVYGQMGELFDAQNLPTDELEANSRFLNCAKILKDTFAYIRGVELKVKAFYLLHDTLSMQRVLHEAQQLYVKHGFLHEASSIYPSIIDICISHDSLEIAKRLMDIFETKSGLFDAQGYISAGREGYYEVKGLYYLRVHRLDSAEYYFRRLLNFDMMTDAYRGLFSVYKDRKNTDSIAKYVHLYEKALDDEQDELSTQTIHQMSSLYNYQRFLKKADAESKKAARLEYFFLLSLFVTVIVIFVVAIVGIILIHKKKLREEETVRLRKAYAETVTKKDQLAVEMNLLKANHEQLKASEQEVRSKLEAVNANTSQLIKTKEAEISQLNSRIREYAQRLLHSIKLVGNNPQFTLLIEDFHKKATRKKNTSLPTASEWNQFLSLFAQTQPKASFDIRRGIKLSPKEERACILLLLQFTNSEIMSLLNISPQRATNIWSSINNKLFNENNAPTLYGKLKEIPIV